MRRARSRRDSASARAAPAAARKAPAGAVIPPQEREQMIARAAYYRAERRGFAPGYELEDWLEAEAEVDASLRRARG